MDGRLFFFSEADSHLSEKNEYLTMISVPENSKLEHFWDDLDRLGIWNWEKNYSEVNENSSSEGCIPSEEHEHCQHEHYEENESKKDENKSKKDENKSKEDENESKEEENNSKEYIHGKDEILKEGDIWQVKIIHGPNCVYCKSWCLDGETGDEFFKAVQEMFGVDITLAFAVLSKKLSSK
jgi:hypothetical protein